MGLQAGQHIRITEVVPTGIGRDRGICIKLDSFASSFAGNINAIIGNLTGSQPCLIVAIAFWILAECLNWVG